MIKTINKMIRNKKGFTLVELIVVVAILGILAGVAIPRYTGMQGTAKDNVDNMNIKMIENAVAVYHAENDEYPTDMTAFIKKYLNDEELEGQKDTSKKFYLNTDTGKVQLSDADPDTGGTTDWIKITK